jgi:hypothetical protein
MPFVNEPVTLEIHGDKFSAKVILASDNRKSIMIALGDCAIPVDDGLLTGYLPLSFDDDTKKYYELISGQVIDVRWEADEPTAT